MAQSNHKDNDDVSDFCNQTNDNVIDPQKEDSYLRNAGLHPEAAKQHLQLSPSAENLLIINNDKNPEPRSLRPKRRYFFRAKEVSTSIMTSERSRIISSISIALVVVLSFIDQPLLGVNIVNSKSIVAMKPLYILLVTEFTILIAHLVIERRRRVDEDDCEEHPRVLHAGGVSWERAVRVLERGIVAHQMIRAMFIDFSVYVVIVVCVLSLV